MPYECLFPVDVIYKQVWVPGTPPMLHDFSTVQIIYTFQ